MDWLSLDWIIQAKQRSNVETFFSFSLLSLPRSHSHSGMVNNPYQLWTQCACILGLSENTTIQLFRREKNSSKQFKTILCQCHFSAIWTSNSTVLQYLNDNDLEWFMNFVNSQQPSFSWKIRIKNDFDFDFDKEKLEFLPIPIGLLGKPRGLSRQI